MIEFNKFKWEWRAYRKDSLNNHLAFGFPILGGWIPVVWVERDPIIGTMISLEWVCSGLTFFID